MDFLAKTCHELREAPIAHVDVPKKPTRNRPERDGSCVARFRQHFSPKDVEVVAAKHPHRFSVGSGVGAGAPHLRERALTCRRNVAVRMTAKAKLPSYRI